MKSKLKEANLPEEIVMTIHGAQGREWDTVMLSIVDSSDKEKWFTTVKKQGSNGKMVINTAVSRARKKLVIVCDEDYWRKEANKEEIIYGILQCAERTQRVSGHIKY